LNEKISFFQFSQQDMRQLALFLFQDNQQKEINDRENRTHSVAPAPHEDLTMFKMVLKCVCGKRHPEETSCFFKQYEAQRSLL